MESLEYRFTYLLALSTHIIPTIIIAAAIMIATAIIKITIMPEIVVMY